VAKGTAPAVRAIGTHMPEHQHNPVERVGTFEFEVQPAEPTPESEARWEDRVEALADLLLELWEQEQRQEAQAA